MKRRQVPNGRGSRAVRKLTSRESRRLETPFAPIEIGTKRKGDGAESLSAPQRSAIEGRYVFGSRPRDAFVVDSEKDQLGIARVGASRRNLVHLGNLEFHPVGAPAVRIRFQPAQTPAVLTVFDPDLVVSARQS